MPLIDIETTVWDLCALGVVMAKGRKVRASEADGLLREWESSGETMSSWCAARGMNWYSLCAYKGWRSPSREEAAPVGFAEVVVPTFGHEPAVLPTARYRVELGDITVEVDDHFCTETLERLLGVVAGC